MLQVRAFCALVVGRTLIAPAKDLAISPNRSFPPIGLVFCEFDISAIFCSLFVRADGVILEGAKWYVNSANLALIDKLINRQGSLAKQSE
jgi:hypothetical protein